MIKWLKSLFQEKSSEEILDDVDIIGTGEFPIRPEIAKAITYVDTHYRDLNVSYDTSLKVRVRHCSIYRIINNEGSLIIRFNVSRRDSTIHVVQVNGIILNPYETHLISDALCKMLKLRQENKLQNLQQTINQLCQQEKDQNHAP